MKIAMVSDHASPLAQLGGVDADGRNVRVSDLSAAMARRGHDVTVYCWAGNRPDLVYAHFWMSTPGGGRRAAPGLAQDGVGEQRADRRGHRLRRGGRDRAAGDAERSDVSRRPAAELGAVPTVGEPVVCPSTESSRP